VARARLCHCCDDAATVLVPVACGLRLYCLACFNEIMTGDVALAVHDIIAHDAQPVALPRDEHDPSRPIRQRDRLTYGLKRMKGMADGTV